MGQTLRQSLFQRITAPFWLPFPGLPYLVCIYFILANALDSHSRIRDLKFIDTDDYLYMVQAMDWLKGQPWFDLVQSRINPPAGTFVHFSHLLSGLYGLGTAILLPWLDMQTAAIVAAIVFPLIYFLLLLLTTRWAALPFVGRDWAGLTSVVILFLYALMPQFAPGRVDHHGLEAVLAIAFFGCIARVLSGENTRTMAICGAVIAALALNIALEILPVMLVIAGWLALWVTIKGSAEAKTAKLFGLVLFATSAFLLFITRPFNQLLEPALDAYSITYVLMTAGIMLFFIVASYGAKSTSALPRRFMINGLIGVVIVVCFALLFPALKTGPYGGTDPKVVKIIFNYAQESKPATIAGLYTRSLILSLLGVVASGLLWLRAEDQSRRWAAGLLCALIASNYGLSLASQQRFLVFSEAFSAITLVYAVKLCWESTQVWQDRTLKYLTRVLVVLAVGPLTTIIMPLMSDTIDAQFNVAFFPVPTFQTPCNPHALFTFLNDHYGDRSRLIMNSLTPSAEILFFTPHQVLAAPFHKNTEGNLDSYAFFTAPDSSTAAAVIKKSRADLVLLCKPSFKFYTENGSSLAQQLVDGHPPAWLKPITAAGLGELLLFEVDPQALNATQP
jgi:hypothetical protein